MTTRRRALSENAMRMSRSSRSGRVIAKIATFRIRPARVSPVAHGRFMELVPAANADPVRAARAVAPQLVLAAGAVDGPAFLAELEAQDAAGLHRGRRGGLAATFGAASGSVLALLTNRANGAARRRAAGVGAVQALGFETIHAGAGGDPAFVAGALGAGLAIGFAGLSLFCVNERGAFPRWIVAREMADRRSVPAITFLEVSARFARSLGSGEQAAARHGDAGLSAGRRRLLIGFDASL